MPSVPKNMEARYAQITTLTDVVCKDHLSEEYAALSRKAVAALCRKRPSPIVRGEANIWACAVVQALGQVNFLSDKSTKPYMATATLQELFGVSKSSAGNKAAFVRDALKMHHLFSPEWQLSSTQEGFAPAMNMLMQTAQMFGGAPPVFGNPAKAPPKDSKERKAVLTLYDKCRRINREHNTELCDGFLKSGEIIKTAEQLGSLSEPEADGTRGIYEEDVDALLDYTLHVTYKNHIEEYMKERKGLLSGDEENILNAMQRPFFSIFAMERKHEIAGVILRDIFSKEEFWLVDRGLEASGGQGFTLALRIFKPADFWMSTGAPLPLDWKLLGSKIQTLHRKYGADRDAFCTETLRLLFTQGSGYAASELHGQTVFSKAS